MNLSEKGLKKFERHEHIKKLGYVSLIDEIEFEPDDFQGMVCLTAEEAKDIEMCLRYCYDNINGAHFPHTHSEVRFFLEMLRTKIKQMEKRNA